MSSKETNEVYSPPASQQSLEVPRLSRDSIEDIKTKSAFIERDLVRMAQQLSILQENNPELFDRIMNNPNFESLLDEAHKAIKYLDPFGKSAVEMVLTYNKLAAQINSILIDMQLRHQEYLEKLYLEDENSIALMGHEHINQKEQTEIRKMAKEIWEELFPESLTDKFVKWEMDEEGELSDVAKIAAAPMNGIEFFLRSCVSMFKPSTYVNLYNAAKTMTNMSREDWIAVYNSGKFAYENLSATDKIAPVISLITSLVFVAGSATSIAAIAKRLGYSNKIIKMGLGIRNLDTWVAPMSTVLPIATFTGIPLQYLKI